MTLCASFEASRPFGSNFRDPLFIERVVQVKELLRREFFSTGIFGKFQGFQRRKNRAFFKGAHQTIGDAFSLLGKTRLHKLMNKIRSV